jgi:two-component sensor histidine kinase/PAS domain-containing protein
MAASGVLSLRGDNRRQSSTSLGDVGRAASQRGRCVRVLTALMPTSADGVVIEIFAHAGRCKRRITAVDLKQERDPPMTTDVQHAEAVEALVSSPALAEALESDQFRRFLDQVPMALVVSGLMGPERIVYANPEFEHLSGMSVADIAGRPWSVLDGERSGPESGRELATAVTESSDRVGCFMIRGGHSEPTPVDVYSNLIVDDDGAPAFRLVALLDVSTRSEADRQELEQRIFEKDTLLLELQHRVKNNLQLITALIRLETRKAKGRIDTVPFERLAGRIESLAIVYKLMSDHGSQGGEIDLGVYLSEIVSSVMHAHAVEGIRLNLKVDAYPVSVNVAMPTGLVVNELLTNSLKHAFKGRDGGTITLHSLADERGCRIVIADDGVGFPEGVEWPERGKLSELIVRSLRANAKAELEVESGPKGTRVTIVFTRAASALGATG